MRPNNLQCRKYGFAHSHLRSRNRGAMLPIVIVALFLITGVSIAVLSVTSNALQENRRQLDRATAINLAESAAERGALALRRQTTPPNNTSEFTLPGAPNVVFRPGSNNCNQFLKTYYIKGTGTAGRITAEVEIAVKQSSFGKYAYFTDKEVSSASGGEIWWTSRDFIDGPVHSNNSNGSTFHINYNAWSSLNPKRPIFQDMVTGCGGNIIYDPSNPSNETTFKKVFKNGSMGYKLGVERIAMPPTSDAQMVAAWGGQTGFPTTSGVYLRAGSGGGVYIRGDAAIAMSVNSCGNQVMKITQGANITTITYDKAAGTTTATGPLGTGSPASACSLSNGVIYCTGNITDLKGVIADNQVSGSTITKRSAFTIATDVAAGKNITINTKDIIDTNNAVDPTTRYGKSAGDTRQRGIFYKTKPDKTKSATDPANLAAGTLGLVARNINIATDASGNHPTCDINAVMMAGGDGVSGSIAVNNYASGSTGNLNVIGGLIQSARGPVGTFNPATGASATGYSKNYSYDARLANDPPPCYPTTGQYERTSWMLKPIRY